MKRNIKKTGESLGGFLDLLQNGVCVRVFMGDIFLFDLWDNNNNNRGKKMRRGEKE